MGLSDVLQTLTEAYASAGLHLLLLEEYNYEGARLWSLATKYQLRHSMSVLSSAPGTYDSPRMLSWASGLLIGPLKGWVLSRRIGGGASGTVLGARRDGASSEDAVKVIFGFDAQLARAEYHAAKLFAEKGLAFKVLSELSCPSEDLLLLRSSEELLLAGLATPDEADRAKAQSRLLAGHVSSWAMERFDAPLRKALGAWKDTAAADGSLTVSLESLLLTRGSAWTLSERLVVLLEAMSQARLVHGDCHTDNLGVRVEASSLDVRFLDFGRSVDVGMLPEEQRDKALALGRAADFEVLYCDLVGMASELLAPPPAHSQEELGSPASRPRRGDEDRAAHAATLCLCVAERLYREWGLKVTLDARDFVSDAFLPAAFRLPPLQEYGVSKLADHARNIRRDAASVALEARRLDLGALTFYPAFALQVLQPWKASAAFKEAFGASTRVRWVDHQKEEGLLVAVENTTPLPPWKLKNAEVLRKVVDSRRQETRGKTAKKRKTRSRPMTEEHPWRAAQVGDSPYRASEN